MKKVKYPTFYDVEIPEEVFVDFLKYWKYLLKPQKGEYVHPTDAAQHVEIRKACDVLIDFLK